MTGFILGYAALDGLFFSKMCFIKKNCEEAMNIEGDQIRGALFNLFVVKKFPFLHLADAALSYNYNNHCYI